MQCLVEMAEWFIFKNVISNGKFLCNFCRRQQRRLHGSAPSQSASQREAPGIRNSQKNGDGTMGSGKTGDLVGKKKKSRADQGSEGEATLIDSAWGDRHRPTSLFHLQGRKIHFLPRKTICPVKSRADQGLEGGDPRSARQEETGSDPFLLSIDWSWKFHFLSRNLLFWLKAEPARGQRGGYPRPAQQEDTDPKTYISFSIARNPVIPPLPVLQSTPPDGGMNRLE